jgi:drug/metabolite transporter (DMT)-like permease
MTTPVSSVLLVLVASFIGSFGAVFLKLGAVRLHREIRSLLLNWRLQLGVLLFLIGTVFYVLGLRRGELSVLYPTIALGYVWTLFWSRIFFGEPLTRNKFLGIGMILAGIVILNLGN